MVARLSRQRFKDTTLDYRAERSFARAVRGAESSSTPLTEKRPERVARREFRWKARSRDDDFGLEL